MRVSKRGCLLIKARNKSHLLKASHSSIAYPLLPTFYYLHCFTSSNIICATILVASFGLDEEILPPYQSHTNPHILPIYPPRIMTSSHALESSHRTYLNKIWSYPIWKLKVVYLGDTFVPSIVMRKLLR